MPLQNPDNVVTEERLAEFYQQILPYMGGMPDVLANKFNRADLYSTDEKLIGRWIDGKPIWQKTWTNVTVGTTLLTDVDTIVSVEGMNLESNNSWYNVNGNSQYTGTYSELISGTLKIKNVGNSYSGGAIEHVTIQYTKTTDSAVEIGSDTDYSTTEKIVGTWIDGKPIWQKSFDITETTIHGANAFELTLLSNVDAMISQNFMFMDEGLPNGKPVPKACWVAQDGYTHEASGYWYASYFYINPTTHDLKLRRDGNSGILHMYGTILYTKVS